MGRRQQRSVMSKPAPAPVARLATIEGRRTTVVEREPPLPRKLDQLIGQLFAVSVSVDITPTGPAAACETLRSHRFTTIREGRHFGTDRVLRDLRLQMCADCGAVCVRDVSYDRLGGLPVGRGGPRRRDLILGWYSGARRGGRQYS
jgi:hypothetical protein